MICEVVDAQLVHVGPVASDLEQATLDTFRTIGVRPRAGLRRLLDVSAYCRAALLDGKPVALWGVMGPELATCGEAWLSITNRARAERKQIVRLARRELRAMLATKVMLVSSVLCNDARGKRFAEFLGFDCSDREEVAGGIPFYRGILRR